MRDEPSDSLARQLYSELGRTNAKETTYMDCQICQTHNATRVVTQGFDEEDQFTIRICNECAEALRLWR